MVLSTAWDSPNDAREFAAAMTDWIDQGDEHATVLEPDGTVVTVLFATDAATLETLHAAAADGRRIPTRYAEGRRSFVATSRHPADGVGAQRGTTLG